MKKYLFILLFIPLLLIFFFPREQKEGTFEFTEAEELFSVAISYPVTGIFSLDQKIKNTTDKIYQEFKENIILLPLIKNELSINYTYITVEERYYNVVLFSSLRSNSTNSMIESVYSFVYDKKTDSFLSLPKIITNEGSSIILEELQKNKSFTESRDLLFTFDYTYITIYQNTIDNFISVKLPLKNVSSLFFKDPEMEG